MNLSGIFLNCTWAQDIHQSLKAVVSPFLVQIGLPFAMGLFHCKRVASAYPWTES